MLKTGSLDDKKFRKLTRNTLFLAEIYPRSTRPKVNFRKIKISQTEFPKFFITQLSRIKIMQKTLSNLNISSDTIGAIFVIIFASFFIVANLTFGFVWPLFILAMAVGFFISLFQPRAGVLAIIFLTMVWERFFTLQTFFIGKVEYKIYPLDVLMIGIILGIFWQFFSGRMQKVTLHKVDYFLLAFMVINAIYFLASIILNSDTALAFSTFKNYAFYSLFYFIILFLIRTKDDLWRIFKFFLAGGAAIIIFIILGLVRGEGLWSQFTPLSTSGVRLLAFTHGLYISLALMPAILYSVFAKNPNRWVHILIAVWIVGIVGTLMRHMWIAILGVLVALFIFLPKENKRQLWKKIWLILIPIGVAALIFFYSAVMDPQSDFSRSMEKSFGILSQRASSLASVAGDESFSWRSLVWESAYAEFKHNPILGIGTGHKIYVETINYRDFVEIRNIHNSYLAILIQLGLLGASIIFYFFYKLVKTLLRSRGDEKYEFYKFSVLSVLGIFILSIPFQPYLETNLLAIFFWMSLGLARIPPEMKS